MSVEGDQIDRLALVIAKGGGQQLMDNLSCMTRAELIAAADVQRKTINEAQRKLAVIDREILARSERAHFRVVPPPPTPEPA